MLHRIVGPDILRANNPAHLLVTQFLIDSHLLAPNHYQIAIGQYLSNGGSNAQIDRL